jgi:DNA polymerase III epsilon subunit
MSSALLLANLNSVPLTFFDTETTGFYPEQGDRIVEIAMVRVRGGVIEKQWDSLVYPDRGIPEDASRVSGITDAMVWGQPRFGDIVPHIEDMARDSILVAHNAPFDLGFLQVQMTELGRPMLTNQTLDTLVLARKCYNLKDFSLGGLTRALNIEKGTYHRALGDTLMTHRLFAQMLTTLKKKKCDTVGHALTLQGGSARPSIAQRRA